MTTAAQHAVESATKGFPEKFTPMQQLAIDIMTEMGDLNPRVLASAWAKKNNQRRRVASRDNFGNTSAGYRTLRTLETMGVCQSTRIGNSTMPDFKFSLTKPFLMDRKIKSAAAAIASAGLSASELKKACETAARELRKTGMSIWRLTAVERYKLHRRAKRFGCVVHPRLHIININHKTLDSLNSTKRSVLDRLESIGYSIQIEI